MPAIFELVQGPGLPDPRDQAVAYPANVASLSVGVAVAVVLLLSYAAGLLFSLKTHAHLCIAATAISRGLPVVTQDSDFEPLQGVGVTVIKI